MNIRAFVLGLIDALRCPDVGRTHATNQDWNEAYDRGRSVGLRLRGQED
jgi:hypothetical protein